MVRMFLVEYSDPNGNRVWWHETLNTATCQALVEELVDLGRRPEVLTFEFESCRIPDIAALARQVPPPFEIASPPCPTV